MSGSLQRWLHHPLTRSSAFMHLWAGQTAAQVDFQVSILATSAITITALRATEAQIGILSGLQTLAFLLAGLPAGAWVDGQRKHRVMIAANLTRIAALMSIPIAYAFSSLALTHLMVVTALLDLSTVFFDVAYQSYVPVIASKRYIEAADGRLEASYRVGRAGGPRFGGWLLGVIAPPLAYLLTAFTYICSTWAIWHIRTPKPRPAHSDAPLRSQILEGPSFVHGQRLLFPLFACIAYAILAEVGIQVPLPILVLRTLGMNATQLGLLLNMGIVGGVLGALTRPLWIPRLGIGCYIAITNIDGVVILAVQPASVHIPTAAAWVITVAGVVSSCFLTIYNITQVSLRQEICPPDMLGRMNAIFRFTVWGVMPLGSFVVGTVATHAGIEATMYLFTTLAVGAGTAVAFAPATRIRGSDASPTIL